MATLSVLAVKLGPKFLVIATKLKATLLSATKALFNVKTAGIAASVGVYTYLFTWQMGVAFVIFIGIHEYGHVWAMYRRHIRVRGVFFLPGFGAVAIAEDRFGSAENEAYVPIMGPIWGMFLFVFPMIFLWLQTGNQLWAAIASLTTFVNLVNLFPINPLDGGRIVKALAYSENHARALLISVGITTVTVIVAITARLELLMYMAWIGFYESANEFGIREHVRLFLRTVTRIGAIAMLCFGAYYLKITEPLCEYLDSSTFAGITVCRYQPSDWSWIWGPAFIIMILTIFVLLYLDIKKYERKIFYPFIVLMEAAQGIKQVFDLRAAHIKPIEDYTWMDGAKKTFYLLSFIALILLHVVVLVWLAKNPTASIGSELLK